MKKGWHSIGRIALVVHAAIWFQITTHAAVCHDQNDLCGNASAQSSTCSCVCASHPAVDTTLAKAEFDEPICTCRATFEYVPHQGISVPADIFRPPLVHKMALLRACLISQLRR